MAADLQSLIESGNKSLTSGFEAFIKKVSFIATVEFILYSTYADENIIRETVTA